MINFKESANELLDAIFAVHNGMEDSGFAVDQLDAYESQLKILTEYFNCNPQEAAVLATLYRLQISSDSASVRGVLKHAGLKISSAKHIHRALEVFVDRNWLKPVKEIGLFPLTNYQFSQRFVRSVNNMDREKLKEKKIENAIQLFKKIESLLIDRRAKTISREVLIDKVQHLLKSNPFEFTDYVNSLSLSPSDLICFLYYCVKYSSGNESAEVNDLLRALSFEAEEEYRIKKQFRLCTGPLFENDLIEKSESEFVFGGAEYKISDKVSSIFDDGSKENKAVKFSSELMQFQTFDKINHCELFYNDKEKELIQNLHQLINEDAYKEFVQKMDAEGMSSGLTVLLHGKPGTGKTETVFQLARESKRHLLSVEASAIRSKWVGDTEKNLKKMFKEYHSAAAKFGHTPILLFNEADAILTKRGAVKDRGDHYENAIQNLLLQELENFKGIFIGTTNLTENLDNAFQRRILYKIHFNKPVNGIRRKIFHSAFPHLTETEVIELAEMYHMTGSEIMNVKKKIVIRQMLQSDQPTLLLLHELCQEELSLQSENLSKTIGFRRA